MENYNFAVPQMSVSEIKNLAEQFVVQYYSMMNENPSNLHRFYIDKSSMVYDDLPSFGQQKIHEKFMQMDLKNTKVAVIQLDALLAHMNSVIIQVAGEISKGNNEPRRFMQSFVLVEQSPSSLYVLNDIFRYQDKVFQDEIISSKHSNVNKENIAINKIDTFERNSYVTEETIHSANAKQSNKPIASSFDKVNSHEKHSTNGHQQPQSEQIQQPKPVEKSKTETSSDMNVAKSKNSLKEVSNHNSNNNGKPSKFSSESENKSWAQMASEGKINPAQSKGFQRNNNVPESKKSTEPRPANNSNGPRTEGRHMNFNNNMQSKNLNGGNEEGQQQRRPINFTRGGGNISRGGRGGGNFMRRNVQPATQTSS